MSGDTSRHGRIEELDALRGIASIAVSFAHFHVGSACIDAIGVYAQHGVELFFMISGFVIYMTLQKKQHIIDFVAARFARLYPAYILSIVVIASMHLLFADYLPPAPTLSTFLGNTMIWHPLFGIESVSVVYWTLWVEVRFYFLMGIVLLLQHTEKIDRYLWAWLALVSVCNAYTALTGDSLPAVLRVGYALAIPEQAHYFIAGIIFYKMVIRRIHKGHMALLGLCLLRELTLFTPDKTSIVVVCYGIFFLLVHGRLRLLAARPLVFLGTISYSLYLTHQVVGDVTIHYLSANTGVSSAWQFVMAEVLSIALATAVTYVIEIPSMSAIRQGYRQIRKSVLDSKARSH